MADSDARERARLILQISDLIQQPIQNVRRQEDDKMMKLPYREWLTASENKTSKTIWGSLNLAIQLAITIYMRLMQRDNTVLPFPEYNSKS